MQTLHKLSAIITLMMMVGCAAISPPKSFDENLAYAYGTHAAVLTAAANAVTTGTLSVANAKEVLKLADQAKSVLDAAKLAEGGGDLKTAQGQLQVATQVLQQLLNYLNAQAKP